MDGKRTRDCKAAGDVAVETGEGEAGEVVSDVRREWRGRVVQSRGDNGDFLSGCAHVDGEDDGFAVVSATCDGICGGICNV